MSQVLIPNDWKLCQVKDYIQKIEKRNPVFDPETEFKYVEIGSINTEDKIVESYSKVLGRKASTRARNVIRTNDVIYATTRPYYRNTALVPPHLDNQICSTGFCVLRVKDPEKLDPKFLFYFLQSDHGSNQIAISIRGGSYPAVTNNDIFKILIPLPSIEKQRQITRKLDNIMATIKETRKAIYESHKLIEVKLHNLYNEALSEKFAKLMRLNTDQLNWETKKIKDICESILAGFAQGKKNIEGGIIHLRMNNIGTNFEINLDLIRRVKPSFEQLKKYRLECGDVIFNNTNSSTLVGKSAIFTRPEICLYSNHLTRLRPRKDVVLSEWILFYLRSRWLKGDFRRLSNKWINQAAVSNEKIKNLELPVPLLEVQRKVAKDLQNVSILIADTRNKLKAILISNKQTRRNLENLSYRILDYAFTGKLI